MNHEFLTHLRQSFNPEKNTQSDESITILDNIKPTEISLQKLEKEERSNSIKEPKQIAPGEISTIQPKKSLTISEAGSIDSLRLRINDCTKCELSYGRKRIVFGQGNQNAKLIVVGDFPNEAEDQKGLILSSKEGMLLVQILQSISINIESVYLTNIVKCKPELVKSVPESAIKTCLKILDKQIELIQPALILILGSTAEKILNPEGVKGVETKKYRTIPIISTYHPSQLIKNPDLLSKVWVNMRRIRQFLYATSQE
ncbi:MAG: uracil-DNA glycosylase [Deltaproteobacteria bacterium]|nr:uracil-DNA glycosylase [Deltaproteobacteria bacterium]